MRKAFWAKRFLSVTGGAFGLLSLVYLAKGHPLGEAASEAFVWAVIASAIFTAVSFYRVQQCHSHCEMCPDTAERQ